MNPPPRVRRTSDIVFVAVLGLLAIAPALHIDKSEISEQENRRLASFPAATTNSAPNLRLPKEFEDWFKDRFWGRNWAVQSQSRILESLDGRLENQQAFGKKDGWMFLKGATQESFGWLSYSEEGRKQILDGLRRQNRFCEQRGIRFVFLMAPVKASVYGEQAEWRYQRKGPSRTEGIVEEAIAGKGFTVVWPKDDLIRRKKDGLLYHPADTHWNMFGSRVAFLAFLRAAGFEQFIPREDPGLEKRILDPNEQEDPVDLARVLGTTVHPSPYALPADGPWHGSLVPEQVAVENPDAPIPLSVMVVGDSFRLRFAPWVAAYFRRSFVVKRERYTPDMVDTFRPDIVVGEYCERYLERAGGFSFEKGGR